MPLTEPTGSGAHGRRRRHKLPTDTTTTGKKHHRKHKAKKHRVRHHRAHKIRKTHARKPATHTFHESAAPSSVTGGTSAGAGGLPFAGTDTGAGGSTASASPAALLELTGLDTVSVDGLEGALLDLVGEGKLSASAALAAWTHEQDRLANRAWRRPGGMVRMGGL